MERGLQKANHYNQLPEWVQRVEACQKSGQKVSEWCTDQGIPLSTYYSWQRKVFQAVTTEAEMCFTEISAGPPKKNRKELREYDEYLYKLRHLVENAFLLLKRWRGIATRYAKNVASFVAAVQIRCIAIWLLVY